MKRIVGLLLIAAALGTASAWAGGRRGGILAAPRLFEPSETADLKGKTELLFRWVNDADRSMIQEYQFKLYKGPKTIEEAQIKALVVPAAQESLTLPAELFENGQSYSWQLRGTGFAKTRSAYSIFRVEK